MPTSNPTLSEKQLQLSIIQDLLKSKESKSEKKSFNLQNSELARLLLQPNETVQQETLYEQFKQFNALLFQDEENISPVRITTRTSIEELKAHNKDIIKTINSLHRSITCLKLNSSTILITKGIRKQTAELQCILRNLGKNQTKNSIKLTKH